MMIPHHHHNAGVSHAGTTAHEMCHNPLPPAGHSMSSGFQNNPHPMQYSHCGPPVSHMHNNHTASGVPGNNSKWTNDAL